MISQESMPDLMKNQDKVREELLQTMMDCRILTVGLIAESLHISSTRIYTFLGGKPATMKTLIKILNGLDKIREEYGK